MKNKTTFILSLTTCLIVFANIIISCEQIYIRPTTTSPPITNLPIASTPSQALIDIGDGGLISGKPCEAPCFFEIQIGETQLDQVVSALEHYGVSSCTQYIDNVSCGVSIFIGTHSQTPIIDSIGYFPNTPVSVEAIIKKYGNPDLIQVFPGVFPEDITVSVQLFWDSINMRIHLPEIDGQRYSIENTTNIEWVTFFDEGLYSGLIANGYSKSWNGFGVYTP